MNLNLFDDMEGLILRERENSLAMNTPQNSEVYRHGMSEFPENAPLAMAYVPFQQWGETYNPDNALECGTLFPNLVFSFRGGGDK